MNNKWIKFTLAITVPLSFVLVLIGAIITQRKIEPTVAGGLIAVLGAIVALFTVGETRKNSNPGQGEGMSDESLEPLDDLELED